MVKTGLTVMIQSWEQHISNVHCRSASEQKQKLLHQQRLLILDWLSRQHQCLPKDQFLFQDNPQELLDKTSTVDLGN